MGKRARHHVWGALAALWFAAAGVAQPVSPEEKRRVLVLTDIGNEPDDSESFVRFLLYTDQMDVEGLVATTSTWQRDRIQPQLLRERVAGYAKILANLRRHAPGYPDPSALMAAIRDGTPVYGMAGVGAGKDTDGSRRIVEVVDRPDPRPVFISVWGGAADLAQALWSVRATRIPEQVRAFVAKLRVYGISDQDDAGPWIRRTFPDLFYIASVHGWNQYANAAWTGISGDVRRAEQWPWVERVGNDWLEAHVRRGPLGQLYPPHLYLMEGDTPSFLGLIRNGLNDPEHPEWGGWGGRYVQAYEGAGHRADAFDRFTDPSGRTWYSNQATIFRWRGAFQNDFAARIAWTLTDDVAKANHNPALVLNGVDGLAPVRLQAREGEVVRLSAAGSRDPDGDRLTYRWWHYAEPGDLPGQPTPKVALAGADTPTATITLGKDTAGRQLHVILEVQDDGTPSLTSYRRAIIAVRE
jgi:hypothetical protein